MPRSKYSAAEKLAFLEAFHQSNLPRTTFARQHGIGKATFATWSVRYARDGIGGLEETRRNQHYTKELKLTVVHAYRAGEGAYALWVSWFRFVPGRRRARFSCTPVS